MNPLLQLAVDGIRWAVDLARKIAKSIAANEAELEAHNAAIDDELDGLRSKVKTMAQRTREKDDALAGGNGDPP